MKPARLVGVVSGIVCALLLAFVYTQRSYFHFFIPEPAFAATFIGGTGTVTAAKFIDTSSTSYFLDPAANPSLIVTGAVGIATTGPDSPLDVLDASNPQLRLTQADGTVYTTLQTDSYGNLTISPTANNTSFVGAITSSWSYFGDEFTRRFVSPTADTDTTPDNAKIGDSLAWGIDVNTTGLVQATDDVVDGVVLLNHNAGTTNKGIMIFVADAGTTDDPDLQWNPANKIVYIAKIRQSALTNNCIFAGFTDQTTARTGATCSNSALNMIGFETSGSTLQGVTSNGTTRTTIACAGSPTVVAGQWYWVRIEVISTSSIKFWYDVNAQDGTIDETYCGAATANLPTSNMTTAIDFSTSDGANSGNVRVDYVRIWQAP